MSVVRHTVVGGPRRGDPANQDQPSRPGDEPPETGGRPMSAATQTQDRSKALATALTQIDKAFG